MLEELDEKPRFNINEHKKELEKLRDEKNEQLETFSKKLYEAEKQKHEYFIKNQNLVTNLKDLEPKYNEAK